MSKLTKEELKQKFQTGDKPTEKDFSDLIDSLSSPLVEGDEPSSAVLDGEYQGVKNRALSKTAMAVGAGTIAGLKGWYYSKIDYINKTITLSDKPTYILVGSTLIGGSWSSGTPNIEVNDVISLVNDSKYDLCSKVTAVNGNVITVDSLPFTGLVKDDGAAVAVIAGQFSDGYSLYIPERPDAGLIDFGGGAFSEGGQSMSTNICAHAEGLQTHAYGQYSHTEGRETQAGYAAHAEGRENVASGNHSHAEGLRNTTYAHNSHIEGNLNINRGVSSHIEGRGNVISDDLSEEITKTSATPGNLNYSHVEGLGNALRYGYAGHLEGYENVLYGNYGHIEGNKNTVGDTDTLVNGVHVEGVRNISHASGAHVEGADNIANATATHSHVEGKGNITNNVREHASGQYNNSTQSSDKSKATQFSIGIGTSNSNRKNAVEVKQNGDVYIIGIGGYNGTNSDSAQTLQEILANL